MTSGGDWRGNWVLNEIAARVDRAGPCPVSEDYRPGLVSPDIDWLINYLAQLNKTGRSEAIIVKHAFRIAFDWTMLRFREQRSPINLAGSIKYGFRPHLRSKTRVGLAKELKRLDRAARSGSLNRWLKAWAAATDECQRLVWRPLVGKKPVGIQDLFICPRPSDAISAIAHARGDLASTPANDRRGNKSNSEAVALTRAMQAAVLDLTGRVGINRSWIHTPGLLPDFGRAFDKRFNAGITPRLIRKSK